MSAELPEIAGYRIERPLGKGGMAVVYLATQLSLERRVAIKVLSAEACRDEAHALRFEREARLIAALEHPHIVGIFEVGRTTDGRPFYAMPFMPGGDLTVAGITGEETALIEVLDKILSALEYAHAHGIVHRDVKPANVLFDGFGQPRLADFGIAMPPPQAAGGRLTTEGLAVGSGFYMAPEQARGERVDARADLYSVGVMAFELLTGELPFQGPDPLALALQHLTAPVPRLPERFRRWQEFIDRALAKRPEERFASAAEMREALARLRGESPPPPPRRRSGSWAFAAVTALPLLLLLLWLGRERQTTPDFFLPAPQEAASPEPTPAATEPETALAAALERARARVAAGALALPPEDSAVGHVLAALRIEPSNREALALLSEIEEAILVRVAEAWHRADAGALRAALTEAEEFAAMRGDAGDGFRARLRTRLEASPPRSAELAPVLRDFGIFLEPGMTQDQPPALAAPRESDAPSPPQPFIRVPAELRHARAHSRVRQALIALPRPVSRREFESFVAATGHRPASCRGEGPLGIIAQRSFRDPGFPQEPDDPVVCVSYEDAEAYAAWLGRRLGRRVRLPDSNELQHLALHQSAARGLPLAVREWSSSCAGPGERCLRRQALDPGLDGRRWPLEALALEARRGRSDVGFRLVLE